MTSTWGFCDQENEHKREPKRSEASPRCSEDVPRFSEGVGGYIVNYGSDVDSDGDRRCWSVVCIVRFRE